MCLFRASSAVFAEARSSCYHQCRCFKNADGEQQFTENEAKEHLAEFDENGDGKWSCEEFVTFCMETGDHGHSHLAMVKEVCGRSPLSSPDHVCSTSHAFAYRRWWHMAHGRRTRAEA